MRQITSHKINPSNDVLTIQVVDDAGHGGASHGYIIAGFDPRSNKATVRPDAGTCSIVFQNGPIKEFGVNGVTHEALLAILIDRLQCFQNGPYPSRENAIALTKLEEAKHWLFSRTLERTQRGVEGTTAA